MYVADMESRRISALIGRAVERTCWQRRDDNTGPWPQESGHRLVEYIGNGHSTATTPRLGLAVLCGK